MEEANRAARPRLWRFDGLDRRGLTRIGERTLSNGFLFVEMRWRWTAELNLTCTHAGTNLLFNRYWPPAEVSLRQALRLSFFVPSTSEIRLLLKLLPQLVPRSS